MAHFETGETATSSAEYNKDDYSLEEDVTELTYS